jgi:hypothetical protein
MFLEQLLLSNASICKDIVQDPKRDLTNTIQIQKILFLKLES